jgi:hypothetical protein
LKQIIRPFWRDRRLKVEVEVEAEAERNPFTAKETKDYTKGHKGLSPSLSF